MRIEMRETGIDQGSRENQPSSIRLSCFEGFRSGRGSRFSNTCKHFLLWDYYCCRKKQKEDAVWWTDWGSRSAREDLPRLLLLGTRWWDQLTDFESVSCLWKHYSAQRFSCTRMKKTSLRNIINNHRFILACSPCVCAPEVAVGGGSVTAGRNSEGEKMPL